MGLYRIYICIYLSSGSESLSPGCTSADLIGAVDRMMELLMHSPVHNMSVCYQGLKSENVCSNNLRMLPLAGTKRDDGQKTGKGCKMETNVRQRRRALKCIAHGRRAMILGSFSDAFCPIHGCFTRGQHTYTDTRTKRTLGAADLRTESSHHHLTSAFLRFSFLSPRRPSR